MNLNRWEKLKKTCLLFWKEKIVDHIMEHVIGLSLLAGAALLSVCWGFVASPALEQSLLLKEQEIVLKQRITKLDNLAAKEDYASYERKLQQELNIAEKAIGKNPDLNKLSQIIVKMAEQQLLQVSYLHLPEADAVKRHPKLPIEVYPLRLSIKGDYYALVRFVEKAEEHYQLRGISIEGNQDGSVTAELEILAHAMV